MRRSRPGIELPEEGLDFDGGPVGVGVAHNIMYCLLCSVCLWAVRWYRYEPFTAIAMCTMASVHESTRGTKGSFEVDDTSCVITEPRQQTKLKSKSNPKTRTMAAAAATNSASEVEETLARIRSHNGVEGVIIMNREGELARKLQPRVWRVLVSYRAARVVLVLSVSVPLMFVNS